MCSLAYIDSILLYPEYVICVDRAFPWGWKCEDTAGQKECVRVKRSSEQGFASVSSAVCKLTCYESSIVWPAPTGEKNTFANQVVPFAAKRVKFTRLHAADPVVISYLIGHSPLCLLHVTR